MANVLQKLLRISPAEASFGRRKFHFVRDAARQHLEQAGETFLRGYNLAIADGGIELLVERLNQISVDWRGFGFEGAAMGLDLLDQLWPWRSRRIDQFLRNPGRPHVYMVHVGIGWSMARWRFGIARRLARLDPLLRWLALDGYGFHEGYFHWSRYADGRSPAFLRNSGYGLRSFRQGLGRSLWFVGGADPEFIASAIMRFPQPQQDDLWSGIGLACAYAGGAASGEIDMLRSASGTHWPHLAQGAVFAAGARQRAGNMTSETDTACQSFCNISAKRAAELCAETLRAVTEGEVPAYEEWRRLIRAELLFGQNFDERSLISGSESLISSAPDGLLCLWSPISELEAALTNYKENWR